MGRTMPVFSLAVLELQENFGGSHPGCCYTSGSSGATSLCRDNEEGQFTSFFPQFTRQFSSGAARVMSRKFDKISVENTVVG